MDRSKIPYDLTVESRQGFVHARVIGERTPDNVLRFLREAHEATVRAGHAKSCSRCALPAPASRPRKSSA